MSKLIARAPWDWVTYRRSVMTPAGAVAYEHVYEAKAGPNLYQEWMKDVDHRNSVVRVYDFTYYPRSFNVAIQKRMITCHGEEWEQRMRWLRFLPWPRRVWRTISVQFSQPTGERAERGGGVMTMTIPWGKGESFDQVLHRYMAEVRNGGL